MVNKRAADEILRRQLFALLTTVENPPRQERVVWLAAAGLTRLCLVLQLMVKKLRARNS